MRDYRNHPQPEAPLDAPNPPTRISTSMGRVFTSGNAHLEPEWMKGVCAIDMTPAEFEAAMKSHRRRSVDASLRKEVAA